MGAIGLSGPLGGGPIGLYVRGVEASVGPVEGPYRPIQMEKLKPLEV